MFYQLIYCTTGPGKSHLLCWLPDQGRAVLLHLPENSVAGYLFWWKIFKAGRSFKCLRWTYDGESKSATLLQKWKMLHFLGKIYWKFKKIGAKFWKKMAKNGVVLGQKITKQGFLFGQRLKIFFKSLFINASTKEGIFAYMFSVLKANFV